MATTSPAIRPPAVAGQFYPARPSELQVQIEDLLSRAPDAALEGEVHGLIVPHAGYPYSGQTAAAAYRQVRGKPYDTVVVMAPSHREACRGVSIFPGEGYETPLGVVPTDQEMAGALAQCETSLHLSWTGHCVAPDRGSFNDLRGEHAVEVQIPFLQVVLPEFRVVSIVMDTRSLDICRPLADALVRASERKRVLLVASSDLYHGHDYTECVDSDARTLQEIEAFDPARFAADLETDRVQACGGGPITVLMLAARQMGGCRVQIVSHTNSNNVAGTRRGYVVGYGAALFYAAPPEPGPGNLAEAERTALGRIARKVVRQTVYGETPGEPTRLLPRLRYSQGAFVTLHSCGKLRGCIGDVHGREPLGLTVQKMAVAAATQDPRFPPLTEEELENLEIEISVLSPMQQVTTPAEIEVGRHGLWIRQGTCQGILLPQVAETQGWDRIQFLNRTCAKAGLPEAAWQHPDTEIWTFSADIFPA